MTKVYAIPGLNTTKELFRYLSLKDVELVVLEWPAPVRGETMPSYAQRFARQIDTSKPFYLLGVSFGGMLCVELSQLLSPKKTFLISSAKSPSEFPPSFPVMRLLRLHLMITEKMYMRMIPRSRKWIGFEKDFLPEFIKMVHSMPEHYYRRSTNCILNWHPMKKLPENVVHIHGTADRLLPAKYVKADYLIEGGTHAMIVYKAKEISEILNIEISK
jgi:hypothetical protein